MEEKRFWKNSRKLYRTLIVLCAVMVVLSILALYFGDANIENVTGVDQGYSEVSEDSDNPDRIVDGIHVRTGLVAGEGLMTVVNNCTSCHSAQLVIQNRMDKERWVSTIRWMQKTQNLWDLGENEAIIIDYLVANYPPIKKGRRQGLTDIDWYELKE